MNYLLSLLLSLTIIVMTQCVNAMEVDFAPNTKIITCYRLVPTGSNPFTLQGEFSCSQSIVAIDAPFPGGGVTGKQIVELINKSKVKGEIKNIRAHNVVTEKPFKSGGAMIVTGSDGNYYNSYVYKPESGDLKIYLDLEI